MRTLLIILFATLTNFTIFGQYSQTIRGTITDKDSHSPLIGANIVLVNSNPSSGTTSDKDGNYRLANVPLGRQAVLVSYVGYKPAGFQNQHFFISYTLDQLASLLDPLFFFRANRQYIVSLKSVTRVHNYFNSKLKLELNPLSGEEVIISREKAQSFKNWMNS